MNLILLILGLLAIVSVDGQPSDLKLNLINPHIKFLDTSECSNTNIAVCNITIETAQYQAYRYDDIGGDATKISRSSPKQPQRKLDKNQAFHVGNLGLQKFADVEQLALKTDPILLRNIFYQNQTYPHAMICDAKSEFKSKKIEYITCIRGSYLNMCNSTSADSTRVCSVVDMSNVTTDYIADITAVSLDDKMVYKIEGDQNLLLTISDIAGQIMQFELLAIPNTTFGPLLLRGAKRYLRTNSYCDPMTGCSSTSDLKDRWLNNNNLLTKKPDILDRVDKIFEARKYHEHVSAITTIFKNETRAMCWTSNRISYDNMFMKCTMKGEDQSDFIWKFREDRAVKKRETRIAALYVAHYNGKNRIHVAYSTKSISFSGKSMYYTRCVREGEPFASGKPASGAVELQGQHEEGCVTNEATIMPNDIIGLLDDKCIISLIDFFYVAIEAGEEVMTNQPSVLKGLRFAYSAATSIGDDIYFFTSYGFIVKAKGKIDSACTNLEVEWDGSQQMSNKEFFDPWVFADDSEEKKLPNLIEYELDESMSDTRPSVLSNPSNRPSSEGSTDSYSLIITVVIGAIFGLLILAVLFYIVCVRSNENNIKDNSRPTQPARMISPTSDMDLHAKTVRSSTSSSPVLPREPRPRSRRSPGAVRSRTSLVATKSKSPKQAKSPVVALKSRSPKSRSPGKKSPAAR